MRPAPPSSTCCAGRRGLADVDADRVGSARCVLVATTIAGPARRSRHRACAGSRSRAPLWSRSRACRRRAAAGAAGRGARGTRRAAARSSGARRPPRRRSSKPPRSLTRTRPLRGSARRPADRRRHQACREGSGRAGQEDEADASGALVIAAGDAERNSMPTLPRRLRGLCHAGAARVNRGASGERGLRQPEAENRPESRRHGISGSGAVASSDRGRAARRVRQGPRAPRTHLTGLKRTEMAGTRRPGRHLRARRILRHHHVRPRRLNQVRVVDARPHG